MTQPTLKDWIERRNNIRKAFPDELLEDLKDREPELYAEAQLCDQNILHLKKELKNSTSQQALLPSLLTEGWNLPRPRGDRTQNWPDMENILKLYAIGLYFRSTPLSFQAEHDRQELTQAVEQASISPKNRHPISASTRIQTAHTYLHFGLKTLDAFFMKDPIEREQTMHELNREVEDALWNNPFNGSKLQKSQNMALRVGRIICNRYKD